MGLFSTTHHHHTKTVSVPYEKTVTVKEHRAPTDESIALLNEMQEKAKQNLIASVKVEANYVKALAIYFQDDLIADTVNYCIRFELNGKEYNLKGSIERFELHESALSLYNGLGHEAIFKKFHKFLSEIIAEELMKQSPDFLRSIASLK